MKHKGANGQTYAGKNPHRISQQQAQNQDEDPYL